MVGCVSVLKDEVRTTGIWKIMKTSTVLALSAAIGALAGLRTFAAPAVLSQAAKRRYGSRRRNRLKSFATSRLANSLTSMAASELVYDKLSSTPSRLDAVPLAARLVSGALCGAAVCFSAGEPIGKGAVLGGIGAIAGAYAGYHLRQRLDENLPDVAVALIEDAIAIGGSVAVVSAL